MDKKEQIREGLRDLAKRVGPVQTILATVVSVNEAEFTCVLNDGDIDIHDVRLRPVLNGNEAQTLIPKAGSYVLAIRIEEWMLMAADEIDKYRVKIGDMEFEMDGSKFLFKMDSETLKKIMDDLLDAIEQLTVNTNVGPSSVPINIASFIAIKTRVDNFLK
jgi:hypothetical protein